MYLWPLRVNLSYGFSLDVSTIVSWLILAFLCTAYMFILRQVLRAYLFLKQEERKAMEGKSVYSNQVRILGFFKICV